MSNQEPQFTVTDRRKFTLEGELREGEAPQSETSSASTKPENTPVATLPAAQPEPAEKASPEATPKAPEEPEVFEEPEGLEEPTAEESAQQTEDYHASARQLDSMLQQADPAGNAAGPMNFDRLVQSVYMTAAMQMGAGTPPNEQPRIDIFGARQSIDMLAVLEEKTKGNLTNEEKRLLQSALFELRMLFLEITNAIAKSAQKPPKPGIIH